MAKSKNEQCWEKIFDKYKVLDEVERRVSFEINSDEINEFRESRLMTKFDYRKNLPDIFRKNGLSILPITRGRYLISRFDAYHSFENVSSEIVSWSFPDNIESIDYRNITSEPIALCMVAALWKPYCTFYS